MATFSFDVVSDYSVVEMNNVFDQTQRELKSRYDFKGTPASLEWLDDKKGLKITGSGEWQIDTILDIVRKKLGPPVACPKKPWIHRKRSPKAT